MDERVVDTGCTAETIEVGSTIANKYTILRPDERGSPGSFICREAESSALVSVWALKPRHKLDPNADRFREELAKVSKLEHPQLRKLLDFGRDDECGILYAAYEPLELRNLNAVLEQDWPLPDERVVWLACQVLAAIEVAHAAGLTHGDLRPENILVRAAGSVSQTEEIVLCGLGLAGSARYAFSARPPRSRLALADWMFGTPLYGSPEQIRGEPHDARSDVYAAGLLLFQLLTRTQPFQATNDHDTAWMQCFTPPPPPSGYYRRVSAALEAICLKALTKTPDLRYQSANEFRAALLASQATRPSRTTGKPSVRPSQHSIPPGESQPAAIVVAPRISQSAPLLARAEVMSTEAVERSVTRQPEPTPRRGRSAAVLLVCCALAITLAAIIPDLKVMEAGVDGPALSDGFSQPMTGDVFASDRVLAAEAATVLPEPAAQVASAPSLPIATALATTPPPAPAAAPPVITPAATPPKAARRAEAVAQRAALARRSERVRMRTIERSLVAAEASRIATATPASASVVLADVSDLEPVEPETASLPAPVAIPEVDISLEPIAATTEASMPPPVTAPDLPPQPIVLASTQRPATAPPSSIANEVDVVIGDTTSAHGAVSKAAVRGGLNQAALARCYLESVRRGESAARSLNARLEIGTDLSGRIVSAKLGGAGLPSRLVRCVEAAARLGRVREADTGEMRATVELRFEVK